MTPNRFVTKVRYVTCTLSSLALSPLPAQCNTLLAQMHRDFCSSCRLEVGKHVRRSADVRHACDVAGINNKSVLQIWIWTRLVFPYRCVVAVICWWLSEINCITSVNASSYYVMKNIFKIMIHNDSATAEFAVKKREQMPVLIWRLTLSAFGLLPSNSSSHGQNSVISLHCFTVHFSIQ